MSAAESGWSPMKTGEKSTSIITDTTSEGKFGGRGDEPSVTVQYITLNHGREEKEGQEDAIFELAGKTELPSLDLGHGCDQSSSQLVR